MTTILIYYIWLNEKRHGGDEILMEEMHVILYWTSIALLFINVPLFILTSSLDPGYLKPFYDFTILAETALEIGLHLDNLCSYCEVIKSESSFHCTICNRCVELFDHHCPFVNNCLGYRNHKYFLAFIGLYSLFLLILLVETFRHFIEIYSILGFKCFYTDSLCTTNFVLIGLHIPVFLFQWKSQCFSLCKRPNLPPQFIQNAEQK